MEIQGAGSLTGSPYQFGEFAADRIPAVGEYWRNHEAATFCHHPGWFQVIGEAYRRELKAYGVMDASGKCRGAALLVFFQGPISGKVAVALPYLDYGGPLADDEEALEILIQGLKREARRNGSALELRCQSPLPVLPDQKNSKVSLMLDLRGNTYEAWWKSLDAKVRNQVRKAEKNGVTVKVGREDALEAFYPIFCENMRDLGSPVHSRDFFRAILKHIPECEIALAMREGSCLGGLVRIPWRNGLAIPWASTLRSARVHCPNNAIYNHAIRHAFEAGMSTVDFGRSTLGEGTHKFKLQWLAKEAALPWYQFDADGNLAPEIKHVKSAKWEMMVGIWSKLPLPLANVLGPRLRGGIPA